MPPLHGLERKGTWPYLSLPVVTKTGSHNLDAPYLARQRCRGKSASTNTYGDRAPSLVRQGVEVARRADRGDAHKGFTQLWAASMRKTLLLLCGFVLCSCSGACGATVHASCWRDRV